MESNQNVGKGFGDFFPLSEALGHSETSAFSSRRALAEETGEKMEKMPPCSVPQ